jgi:hypothetical protein
MPVKKLSMRFADLLAQVKPIEATKKHVRSEYSSDYDTVDGDAKLAWRVKCRNLLASACGKQSEHYTQFVETEKPQSFRDGWEELQQLKAIMLAAQEDYDGGYLDSARSLAQAEVFGNELDQATELLRTGYSTSAAVVAGVVLETKLRDMSTNLGLATGKLDKMNADLAKAGAYDLSVQKRITALADVRNNAAHGHPTKFTKEDVEDMIKYLERFLADHP